MNKDTQTQREIVNRYWDDVDMLPSFINNTSYSHTNCRELSREIFSNLSVLFEPKVLSNFKINSLYESMLMKLADMLFIDDNVSYLYYQYIIELFEYYLQEAIDYEAFETSENILRLLKLTKKL